MTILLSSGLAGCSPGPSIGVLGAYFPDWLFCITGAVIATILVHSIVRRFHRESWFALPALTYPLLAAVIALGSWLLVFQL